MNAASESVYDVRGMTCASCAKRVERAIAKVEGVTGASVDVVRERARVVGAASELELMEAVKKAGYELVRRDVDGGSAARRDLDVRTVLAVALATLLLVVDFGVPHLFGSTTPWIALGVATFVTFGLGSPIFARALRLARARDVNMDTLVALGTTAALVLSVLSLVASTHGAHGHSDASTAALVIAIVLMGRMAEAMTKRRAASALDALALAEAGSVRVTRHGETSELPVAELRADDVVHVAPFALVPADGTLESDRAYLDEAALTGETNAVAKVRGDLVLGGSLNGPSPAQIRVTHAGAASMRGRLEADTAVALGRPPRHAALADRASRFIVPIALGTAVLSFVVRLALGEAPLEALRPAIDALVIACPCALGLATPAALVVSLSRAAREGIVVRDAARFLDLPRATHLFFDKTGTLTEGRARVRELVLIGDHPERDVLQWIASVEADSEHPIGHALFLSAMERGVPAHPATDVRALAGRGIEGVVDGRAILVEGLTSEHEPTLDWSTRARIEALRAEGCTISILRVDGRSAAVIAVRDRVRANAASVLDALRKDGLELAMLSGDHASAAGAVAKEVGLGPDAVHAPLRPEEKAAFVREARLRGIVAMVGDGVNDAPALALADVGIAIGGGAGVAVRSAALTLRDGNLGRIHTARALALATDRTLRANLVWAFAYNLIALPIAALGMLDALGGAPVAAAAMAGSSIAVLLWSLRLARVRLA